MHWRVQVAVELEDVQLLVVLELVGAVLRNFDHRPEHFGRTIANGQFQIINHSFLHPLGVGSGSAEEVLPDYFLDAHRRMRVKVGSPIRGKHRMASAIQCHCYSTYRGHLPVSA